MSGTLGPITVAAFGYAAAVFAAGVALGTLRALVVAPRIGEAAAVLAEVPVMLALSFLAARWAAARWAVPPRIGPRLIMGGLAFALLMAFEAALAILCFGLTLEEHLLRLLRPAARPGLAAQFAFAAMPALLALGRRRG